MANELSDMDENINQIFEELRTMINTSRNRVYSAVSTEREVRYEFILDIQFLSSKEIQYKELVMIKDVIEILELNRETAISRLKKWTVQEYKEDRRQKEKRSEEMLEALKKSLLRST